MLKLNHERITSDDIGLTFLSYEWITSNPGIGPDMPIYYEVHVVKDAFAQSVEITVRDQLGWFPQLHCYKQHNDKRVNAFVEMPVESAIVVEDIPQVIIALNELQEIYKELQSNNLFDLSV